MTYKVIKRLVKRDDLEENILEAEKLNNKSFFTHYNADYYDGWGMQNRCTNFLRVRKCELLRWIMMTSVICNRFEGYFNFRKTNSSGTFVISVTVLVWVIYLLISFNGSVFMLNDKSVTGTLTTNSLAASDNLRLFSHFNSNKREKTRNLCKNFTMKLKNRLYLQSCI